MTALSDPQLRFARWRRGARTVTVVGALALGLLACADASESARADSSDDTPTSIPTPATATPVPTATPTPAATATPVPTATSAPAPSATPQPTPTSPPEPDRRCVRIADFAAPDAGQGWFIVNDGVMGGLSAGSASIISDGVLKFEGEINTNGGGFSSVRVAFDPGVLADTTSLRIRARNLDGRTYEVIVDDVQPGRDRRISHFGVIPLTGSGEWETVEIPFDSLDPRVFGRAIESTPVAPGLVGGVGIILSDGIDGPFELEVSTIDACEAAPEPPIEP